MLNPDFPQCAASLTFTASGGERTFHSTGAFIRSQGFLRMGFIGCFLLQLTLSKLCFKSRMIVKAQQEQKCPQLTGCAGGSRLYFIHSFWNSGDLSRSTKLRAALLGFKRSGAAAHLSPLKPSGFLALQPCVAYILQKVMTADTTASFHQCETAGVPQTFREHLHSLSHASVCASWCPF